MLSIPITVAGECIHAPKDWTVKATPRPVGLGYLMVFETITCKCGAVANLTDARGVRSPATTLGVDFLTVAPTITDPATGVQRPKPKAAPQPAPEPLGPGPGTELSQELERLGISSCQACKGLARLMNQWGSNGCRERLEEIVADVLPRARAWYDHATIREKLKVWWNSDNRLTTAYDAGTKAATWQLDDALRAAIRIQVLAALDRWEQKDQ